MLTHTKPANFVNSSTYKKMQLVATFAIRAEFVNENLLLLELGNTEHVADLLSSALWIFLKNVNRSIGLENALVQAVAMGGDTDTRAAIVGALMGSVRGIEDVPLKWLNGLEDFEHIIEINNRLLGA